MGYQFHATNDFEPTYGRCPRCDGMGVIAYDARFDEDIPCPDCRGKGWHAAVLN